MGRVARQSFYQVIGLVWLTAITASASADLLISSPPRQTAEEAQRIYGPVAELLSKAIGERVTYAHPANWIEYINSMRKGTYDIVFDGPHFAAWRMKHLGHVPAVKLPGSLSFVLVVRADDATASDVQDLKTSAICTLSPPNLGAMSVLSQFDNPVIQPELVEVVEQASVIKVLKQGKCRGAVVQEKFFKKLDEADRTDLKVIYTSRAFPEQTITLAPKLTEKMREAVVMSLAARDGVPEATQLLATYTKQATYFEIAAASNYEGLEALLEGEIWGW